MGFLRLLAAGLALVFLAAPSSSSDDPEAIVRAIYAQYGVAGKAFDVPSTYFSAGLLELWRSVDAAAEGGVETSLGFEVFTDANDEDIVDGVETHFMAGKYVVVRFMVMVEDATSIVGHRKFFMYTFVETQEGWKIDDIDWGREKPTLRGMLGQLRAVQSPR